MVRLFSNLKSHVSIKLAYLIFFSTRLFLNMQILFSIMNFFFNIHMFGRDVSIITLAHLIFQHEISFFFIRLAYLLFLTKHLLSIMRFLWNIYMFGREFSTWRDVSDIRLAYLISLNMQQLLSIMRCLLYIYVFYIYICLYMSLINTYVCTWCFKH